MFFSRPRSERWPHQGRTFSIYPCPLSFWLSLPRRILSTSWCCPSRPCVAFLTFVHLALFLALSLSPGNSLVSSWCDHSMLASLLWRCLTVPLYSSFWPYPGNAELVMARYIESYQISRYWRHIITAEHTHTRLKALCLGLPGWASTRKVKPIWILLKQETVSGSGISWDICKSAHRCRQITMPAPHHSVFYRPDALPAAQPTVSKHWRLIITAQTNSIYRGFEVKVGMHQGSALSPLLFMIVMEVISREFRVALLLELLYADDSDSWNWRGVD